MHSSELGGLDDHRSAESQYGHGGGSGHLRLWRDQDVLYCQVSDHGPGITDATIGLHAPDPEQSGGRGLWLIRQLADTLDITSTITGATTTAAFHLSHQN